MHYSTGVVKVDMTRHYTLLWSRLRVARYYFLYREDQAQASELLLHRLRGILSNQIPQQNMASHHDDLKC
jgi:hypothetical protein